MLNVFPIGQVLDGTDGKLVHLHGLNFSRAWNLYSLARRIGKSTNYTNPYVNERLNDVK